MFLFHLLLLFVHLLCTLLTDGGQVDLKKYISTFLFPVQVVELISSAIGDLVQGVYYENPAHLEVRSRVLIMLAALSS